MTKVLRLKEGSGNLEAGNYVITRREGWEITEAERHTVRAGTVRHTVRAGTARALGTGLGESGLGEVAGQGAL